MACNKPIRFEASLVICVICTMLCGYFAQCVVVGEGTTGDSSIDSAATVVPAITAAGEVVAENATSPSPLTSSPPPPPSTISSEEIVWNPHFLPWFSSNVGQIILHQGGENQQNNDDGYEENADDKTEQRSGILKEGGVPLNDTAVHNEINFKIVDEVPPETQQEEPSEVDELVILPTPPPETSTAGTTFAPSSSSSSSPAAAATTTISPTTPSSPLSSSPPPPPPPSSSPRSTSENCEKLTSDQLYEKLERVGGRNQIFMANSPEEAGQNFPILLPEPSDLHDAVEHPFYGNGEKISYGDQNIKAKLTAALGKRNDGILQRKQNDTGPPEVQEGEKVKGGGDRQKSSPCYLETFIPLSNCSSRGEEEVWGYEKLCSACHGVYLMSKHCFPQFFNAVVCNKQDARCIFDRFTNGAHGKCQARSLGFKVMRNVGSADCPKWQFEYLHVPISCECYLSKSSWLMA